MLVEEEEGSGPYAPGFLGPKRQRGSTEVCSCAGGSVVHGGNPETGIDRV